MGIQQLCPVCGFDLSFTPWSIGIEAERPCPCCGIHFGHDDRLGCPREEIYATWRRRWIEEGKRWWSTAPRPADFNPDEQLARLGAKLASHDMR